VPLFLACVRLPHCVFDTPDNKTILSRWEWFVRAFAGFLIFTVIGGTLLSYFKDQLSKLFTHP
jgi:heme A synthase